jgi:thiol-disulfide isomerase/thioredoxin
MRPLAVLLLAAASGFAADSVKEAPKPLRPADGGIGRLVPDAGFVDLAGKAGNLGDSAAKKLLVVAVTNTTCPVSKKFAPTLASLEKDYAAKGVAFLFVNPTKADKPTNPFQGRYVHDTNGQLAATLGFTSTTEVVVLDSARTVVYRGAVDDQYGVGYQLDAPKTHFLKNALDSLLAEKKPDVQATTAPGCSLDLAKPTATTAVTYHNRVSRIVQENCQTCHRAGGVGPFALESYDDVVSHKGTIRKVVDKGTMPPWFAAEPNAGEHSPFVNDRSLSTADKADLLAWLKSDLPKGNEFDAPRPRAWPAEWQIGKPDAIFQIGKPIAVKATGTMPYQNVIVETNLDEDKWVEAYEVRPTAKAVVHHVLVHVIPKKGLGRLLPGARVGVETNVDDERQGYFAAYVPGNGHVVLPPGFARKLPKGATLRFQIHYTPNGEATEDQTRVGFVFAKQPPKHAVKVGAVMQPGIRIPPGDGNHKEVGKLKVPADIVVRSLMPHMHVRGKACRYEMTTPDGKTTTLLDIPHYDFNWQLRYVFAEPVRVPNGATLTFTVWYDNSEKNPANPDPTRLVRWGPQTSDEMHLGYVEYLVDTATEGVEPFKADEKPMIPKDGLAIPERFTALLGKYDTNGDKKLDEKEIDAMPEQLRGRVWDFIRKTRD